MQRHLVFRKYKSEWLHELTGYSRIYLLRVASGKVPLSRAFIERVSFKLNEPAENLFLLDAASVPSSNPNHN